MNTTHLMATPTLLRSLQRFAAQGKRMPILLGVCGTLLVLWLQIDAPGIVERFVQRLEYLVYDTRLEIMPKAIKSPENKIVIVDLDERSLQVEGQYPWNRIKVGRLTEKLRDAGVLVVGFDITFPEPDRNIRDLLEPIDLASLDSRFVETLAQIEPQIDSDQYFANAMQSGIDTVLAINFNPQTTATYNELPRSIVDIGAELAMRIAVNDMTGYTGNLRVLQDAAKGNGSMNQQPDEDGIVRRVPLIIRFGSELFPTLSLEMVRVYSFLEKYELVTQSYDDLEVVTAVRIGSGQGAFVIPTDGSGQVNVPFVGRSSLDTNEFFPYISATDVLRDALSEEEKNALQNSLVLVGTSAPGLGDLRAMPLQRVYPGVEVHANMLNALLSSVTTVDVSSGESSTEAVFADFRAPENIHFPYKPDWEAGALVFVMTVLGLSLAFGLPYVGATSMAGAAIVLIAGIIWANFQLWDVYKMDFSVVLLLMLVFIVTAINLIYGFLSESQTRRVIKGMFDQYVPPAHIDSMLKNPDDYSFDGESKELTVLFSDIRSFTTISESLSATQLKKMLNDFFTPITGIIFENQGTIDKYVGDMVMAFWGAPLDDPNHRQHAVKAALEMLDKVEALKPVFRAQGFPEVNIGVGVNSGIMNVGDMGSTYRRSYTVLGDAVNLGSRLESLTKFYGIRLLIGEETAKELPGILLRRVDRMKVKGKIEAIDCYEPICLLESAGEQLKARVEKYHAALDFYYAKRWDEAEQMLQELSAAEPHTLLYQVYLERIQQLRAEPPAEPWDGSYTHLNK